MQKAKEKPNPASDKDYRQNLIKTVREPLGFFTLIALILEVALGVSAGLSNGIDKTILVITFCVVIILLILLVAIMAMFRPTSLYGKSVSSEAFALVSEIQTTLQKIDGILEHAELARALHSLGLIGITSRWIDFKEFESPFGEHLKKRLEQTSAATWYVVSTSPEGFSTWLNIFEKAVMERGIDIKWVYHRPQEFENQNNKGLRASALMVFGRPSWAERERLLVGEWKDNINILKRRIDQSNANIRNQQTAGSWELYESKVPHFFMGFLSVPKLVLAAQQTDSAPEGTFGFVHLYPMFSWNYEDRPAIYFEASGSTGLITKIYYKSILSIFDDKENQGYIQRIEPKEGKYLD